MRSASWAESLILLKTSAGGILYPTTLINVLYVPDVRKNLVSGSLLGNRGFKVVLEGEKLIFSKNNVFVGRGYVSDEMYKLSVNENVVSVYTVESLSLWHDHLV